MKRKRPRDINQLAKMIVDLTTKQATDKDPDAAKDPKAIQRGKLGGLAGGRARASKLSSDRRKAIAQKAARSRWSRGR